MKIHELYNDPLKWTNSSNAINSNDRPVAYNSPNACSWCIIGAIAKCYDVEDRSEISNKVYKYLDSIGEISIVRYNSSYEKAKELALTLDI